MNTNAWKFANLLKIPSRKGINKASVKTVLVYMAAYTSMDDNTFWRSYKQIAESTCLSKEVVIAAREWIEQIGLIRATGRKVNSTMVYKFTYDINISTVAAALIGQHSAHSKSPLKNMKRVKTPQPQQLTLLSEKSDTLLSEKSDTLLSEKSDTIREPKTKKKTSCVKTSIKSPIKLQEEKQKDEGEEGFILLRSLLNKIKSPKKINELRKLSNKHTVHSIKYYHQELLNEMAKGKNVGLGVLLSRLGSEDDCNKPIPLALTVGGGKPSSQQNLSFLSLRKKNREEEDRAEAARIKEYNERKAEELESQPKIDNTLADLGAMYQQQVASW